MTLCALYTNRLRTQGRYTPAHKVLRDQNTPVQASSRGVILIYSPTLFIFPNCLVWPTWGLTMPEESGTCSFHSLGLLTSCTLLCSRTKDGDWVASRTRQTVLQSFTLHIVVVTDWQSQNEFSPLSLSSTARTITEASPELLPSIAIMKTIILLVLSAAALTMAQSCQIFLYNPFDEPYPKARAYCEACTSVRDNLRDWPFPMTDLVLLARVSSQPLSALYLKHRTETRKIPCTSESSAFAFLL